MARCEEIFRQICWLEQRVWPDVDGMGEQSEAARMAASIGPMGASIESNMSAPMPNGIPNGLSNNIPAQNMNGMNNMANNMAPNMNGPMSAGLSANSVNGGDSTPVNDGRGTFGLASGQGLENVGSAA